MSIETWELLSYVVTVIGLPLAIAVFAVEQRKERRNEEEAVYESISDNYQEFLRIVLEHPDLHLFSMAKTPELSEEQQERMMVIFSMLISLFERAYMLLYEEGANSEKLRRWHSWEDYMREWCAREDFRDSLDSLLAGEDQDFCAYIRGLAREVG
jgi:succinate dehydrogenase flavin-adding protein (antitoxin of CptAB toxin-antitoxin module)